MSVAAFGSLVNDIVSRTALFGTDTLKVTLIANPVAGGFTRPAIRSRLMEDAGALAAEALTRPPRAGSVSFDIKETDSRGHAETLMRKTLSDAYGDASGTRRLVVIAGGDGTSLESCRSLIEADATLRERFTVLRLPFGTGNDGSDGRTIGESLGRLIHSTGLGTQRAVKVTTSSGRGPWHAFNIASIGLDAFVTNTTNKLKTSFPGDSYKLFLDVASVLYDKLYKVVPMDIKISKSGEQDIVIRKPTLLCAFGCSGNRQYGSNKRILPGDENLCVVYQMPFLRKLALKDAFARGEHPGKPEASLHFADRIEIGYTERILVQMDGEAEPLSTPDFPLVMELTDKTIGTILPVAPPQSINR